MWDADPEAILKSRRARVVNDDKLAVVAPEIEAEAEADDGDEVDLEEERMRSTAMMTRFGG